MQAPPEKPPLALRSIALFEAAKGLLALAFAYALIRVAEGYGLWQGKHWAEWFAVISAGIYLPLEFQHFGHHATLLNAGVIFFNIVIVLYLARLLIQQRRGRKRSEAGEHA
jgi:uncharacterized membrane protein (DUF2068 family)